RYINLSFNYFGNFYRIIVMQIVIDLDGTICREMRQFSRPLAEPIPGAVETVNELYDRGDTIIIYSARTWAEYEVTVDWLRRHGVKYHQLMLGKPVGDLWIDDRSVNPRDMGWDGIRKQLIDTKQ
ncbi:5' nucleotidase, NT5C type, partial [Paramuribaculum intestinale]